MTKARTSHAAKARTSKVGAAKKAATKRSGGKIAPVSRRTGKAGPVKPPSGTPPSRVPGPPGLPTGAAGLASMINDYAIVKQLGNNKVVMKHVSVLAKLRDVTLSGVLIHKQLTHIGAGGQRSYSPPQGTTYSVEADGDVHFCLGTGENAPHVPCELQHGHNYLNTINAAIGKSIVVSGFFRCLFEHPGFDPVVDAHICEIHPVRAIDLDTGTLLTVDVAKPDTPAIHKWTSPHDLNQGDAAVRATYDPRADAVTFEHIQGLDTNYVLVSGTVTNIDMKNTSPEPAQCTFASPDITAGPVSVLCLKGTNAAAQLEVLQNGARVDLLGLRNIDLMQAMQNRYVINLLGIDIQARP